MKMTARHSSESERRTRKTRIDPRLKQWGWEIAPFNPTKSLTSYRHHAIEEFPTANGPADYALVVDGKLTGSVLQPPIRTVPSGNVGIPRRYYKIILRTKSDGSLEALTIVLPNLQRGLPLPPGTFLPGPKLSPAEADAYLGGHTASIREVETLTGLDLLPNLTADDLKRAVASELWPRN